MLRMYDYQCNSCDNVIEKMTRPEDTSYFVCMECGGEMHRAISAPKVLKPGGEEGQSLKAINEITNKERIKKERIFSRA